NVHGWSFQLYAPVSGLLSMWSAAPAQRNANEFRLFTERIRASRPPVHAEAPVRQPQSAKNSDQRIKIWITNIAYEGETNYKDKVDCTKAPLSWKLSGLQKECIDHAWNKVLAKQGDELDCINTYLNKGDDVSCQYPSRTIDPSRPLEQEP